jgi:hypothetical protein
MYGKDFFASKTTWGALMLIAGPALHAAGIQFEDQAVVDAISLLAGAAVTLWGQFTRTKEITSVAGIEVKK